MLWKRTLNQTSCFIRNLRPINFYSSRRFSELTVSRLAGDDKGIVCVSMNRPKANALSRSLIGAFQTTISELSEDKSARVIILTSSVDRVFCAGADLKERAIMNQDEVSEFVQQLRKTFTDWEKLSQPTIACIDGAALGGGLELALSCDLRVGGKGAMLGLPETGLAIIPGAGGTQRLPRLIGIPRAKELIFTGRRLNAQDAHYYGLLNNYNMECSGYEDALSLARQILPNGPVALKMAKVAIDDGMDAGSKLAGMEVEKRCYAGVIPTKDRLEGIAAFKEKRKPVYTGE